MGNYLRSSRSKDEPSHHCGLSLSDYLFEDASYSFKLQPTGHYLAWASGLGESSVLSVCSISGEAGSNCGVTVPVPYLQALSWSNDGKHIVLKVAKDRDNSSKLYTVDIKGSGSYCLTTDKRLVLEAESVVRVQKLGTHHQELLYLGLNDRDEAWFDLYTLDLSSGTLSMIYLNRWRILEYFLDNNDTVRLALVETESGYALASVETGRPKLIYDVQSQSSFKALAWSHDNDSFFFMDRKSAFGNITLLCYSMSTSRIRELVSEFGIDGDVLNAEFDPISHELVAIAYIDDQGKHVRWLDERKHLVLSTLMSNAGVAGCPILSVTPSLSQLLVAPQTHEEGQLLRVVHTQNDTVISLPQVSFGSQKGFNAPSSTAFKFYSYDGRPIEAFLTRPKYTANEPLPLVVLVHGGPLGVRDSKTTDHVSHFLSDRGYLVLRVNYRGSSGYGAEFEAAAAGEWGRGMLWDLNYGVTELISQGVADPSRIGIIGSSYGGYAAVAAMTFFPQMYRCGVSINGPINLLALYKNVPKYWHKERRRLCHLIGDVRTGEGRRAFIEASPSESLAQIEGDLLLVQGGADARVSVADTVSIVNRLFELKKNVTFLLFNGEGHEFADQKNIDAVYLLVERFFANSLRGKLISRSPERLESVIDCARLSLPATPERLATHPYL